MADGEFGGNENTPCPDEEPGHLGIIEFLTLHS